MFSKFLLSKKKDLISLINLLKKDYKYVSILGSDVKVKNIIVSNKTSNVSDGFGSECGFVVKINNGNSFFEYSFDTFNNVLDIYNIIKNEYLKSNINLDTISNINIVDDKIIKSFIRDSDFNLYDDNKLLNGLNIINNLIENKDDKIKYSQSVLSLLDVSKIFISNNKILDQNYTWVNGNIKIVYENNDVIRNVREGAYSNNIKDVLNILPSLIDKLIDKAYHLTYAKNITPGVYDIITDASISGLIAHEAFGHGVEMDQFVKNRALAKDLVGQDVASSITNMKDGAASDLSVASYFFDDDGILASDTDIIKDGILVSGISDLVSASILGTKPTGNGRRESFKNKVYTRMTNTFFLKGNDKLEDMIKSIKHGYFLFETNNGMEDPKNFSIQCSAEYGIEIIDGKLTNNYVSPVVISGNVIDLLKSISMISNDYHLEGAGSCGKGYKEWVRVSSGGANLKARVKLS